MCRGTNPGYNDDLTREGGSQPPIPLIFVTCPNLFRDHMANSRGGFKELKRWAKTPMTKPVISQLGHLWVLSPGFGCEDDLKEGP